MSSLTTLSSESESFMQLALIMLENVHWEFQRSSTGQAGRVAIQNLQVDNQLLTAAQPVILAKAFQVNTHRIVTKQAVQCQVSLCNVDLGLDGRNV